MATNDDARRQAEELADENDRIVTVADWRVGSDGRLHVPKDTRERHGIEEGDYVDAMLIVPDE